MALTPSPSHTQAPDATSQPAHDPTRILVVDDHPLLRRGVAFLLRETPDMEVVAEAGSGEEALKRCEEQHPHVVLMDLLLPGMSGVDATQALHAKYTDIQLVVLTNYEEVTSCSRRSRPRRSATCSKPRYSRS